MNPPSLARRATFPTIAAIASAMFGWQAIVEEPWFLAIFLGVGGSLVLVLNASARARLPFTAGVLCILASASILAPTTMASVVFRIVGIGFLCVAGLRRSTGRIGFFAVDRTGSTELRQWLPWVVASLLSFLVFAAAFHGQWVNFILYGVGLALLAVAMLVTAVTVPREIVAAAVILALTIVVVGSVLYGVTAPAVAIAGVRLRGLTPNANTLGFYAFLLGSLAMIVVRRVDARVFLFLVSGVVLLWTASRASLLAFAIVVFFVFLSRRSFMVVLAAIGTVVAGLVAVVVSPQVIGILSGVLRGDDSRSQTFDGAMEAFRSSPLIGIGMANEAFEIASSPLRALAYAGIGGLIAVLVVWWTLIWHSRTAGMQAFGFTLAAIVHSVFEGWLLSPVSPLLLVFVLVWWVVVRPRQIQGNSQDPVRREREVNIGKQVPVG